MMLINILILMMGQTSMAEEAAVAVAANFAQTARMLSTAFTAHTSHTLKLSFGASGSLYAQICHGAPYDVFLSADAQGPASLERDHQIAPGSRFTYAVGQLTLWGPDADPTEALNEILVRGGFGRLAISDPAVSPYGMAACQALNRLGLWETLTPQLVRGASVSQTYQFVASGHAPMGMVALAQVHDASVRKGAVWIVPQTFYDPLIHQAVLLNRGKDNPAAQAFLQYLQSAEAKGIICASGYKVD